MSNLVVAVARATVVEVNGTFQRHSSRRSPPSPAVLQAAAGDHLAPSPSYVGRPTASVVVEAYRHLVDDVEGLAGDRVAPPTLWTCQVP